MYMVFFLCGSMCTKCMPVPLEVEEGFRSPVTGVWMVVSCPMHAATESGPLQEQQAHLTTEPSPQPPNKYF